MSSAGSRIFTGTVHTETRGMPTRQRLIVAITGSSGAIYGVRVLEALRALRVVETHLVLSKLGKVTLGIETPYTVKQVEALADEVHSDQDPAAPISSGSFRTAGMIVAPCSMKTLSGIVNSYSDNLVVRAADVVLKERRRLVLMPRETPLHAGHCRLMLQAAELGAILAPPMPAFYSAPKTLDDAVNHSVGRVLDLFDLDSGLVRRWTGAGKPRAKARR